MSSVDTAHHNAIVRLSTQVSAVEGWTRGAADCRAMDEIVLKVPGWCLALSDENASSGAHVPLDPGVEMLTHGSAALLIGRRTR